MDDDLKVLGLHPSRMGSIQGFVEEFHNMGKIKIIIHFSRVNHGLDGCFQTALAIL